MTPEQVRAMAETVGGRYRAFVVLLAGSGLRPGKGLGLTVDRVDFLRRTVRVDRQLSTVAGKPPTLAPVKTPSSVRTVPVPQPVLDELARHLERHSPGPHGLILTNESGQPIRRNGLGHTWWRAAAKMNKAADEGDTDVRVAGSPHTTCGSTRPLCWSNRGAHEGGGEAPQARQRDDALNVYAHLWPDCEDSRRSALDAGLAAVVSQPCHGEPAAGDA
jgi:integrase